MKATVVIILPKLAATRKEFSENNKIGHMPLLTHVTAVKQSKRKDVRRQSCGCCLCTPGIDTSSHNLHTPCSKCEYLEIKYHIFW